MPDQPDDRRFLTAPPTRPATDRCPRCDDGVITTPGYVSCDRCLQAAHWAIATRPGQVVGPADIEAARRELEADYGHG